MFFNVLNINFHFVNFCNIPLTDWGISWWESDRNQHKKIKLQMTLPHKLTVRPSHLDLVRHSFIKCLSLTKTYFWNFYRNASWNYNTCLFNSEEFKLCCITGISIQERRANKNVSHISTADPDTTQREFFMNLWVKARKRAQNKHQLQTQTAPQKTTWKTGLRTASVQCW